MRAKVLGRLGHPSPSKSVCSIMPLARHLRAGVLGRFTRPSTVQSAWKKPPSVLVPHPPPTGVLLMYVLGVWGSSVHKVARPSPDPELTGLRPLYCPWPRVFLLPFARPLASRP